MLVDSMSLTEVLSELYADRDDVTSINLHDYEIYTSKRNNTWYIAHLFNEGEAVYTKATVNGSIQYIAIPPHKDDAKEWDWIIFTECCLKEYRDCHAGGQGSMRLAVNDMMRINHHYRCNIRIVRNPVTVRNMTVAYLPSGSCKCFTRNRILTLQNYKMYD